MTRSRTLMMLTVCVSMSGGCLFTGGGKGSDLAELDTHVQSLNQRIDTLETSRTAGVSASVGASAAGSSVALESGRVASTGAGTSGGTGWPVLAFSFRGSMNKLVRGLTNLVTGWVEVPKRVNETTIQSGALPGFTWGLLRGFGHGFIRTAGGAYEIVTFPFPAPPGYQPVMRPVYVFTCEETGDTRTGS